MLCSKCYTGGKNGRNNPPFVYASAARKLLQGFISGETVSMDQTQGNANTSPIPEKNILLVEDDAMIRHLVVKMLSNIGFCVTSFEKPGDALLYAKKNSRIDLLMTDVVMPEMNGKTLSEKLTSLCPSLKTLFMSGYTANVIAHRGVLDKGVSFIQKPFSIKDLEIAILSVFDT